MRSLYPFLFIIIFFSLPAIVQAQVTVKGEVKTADGIILVNASVSLYYKGENDTLKTISNEKGMFAFEKVQPKNVGLIISYIGYKAFKNNYDLRTVNGEKAITDISLRASDNTLDGITLESNKVQIKEDTISFLIDSTMYRKNDNVEEVLKKLPGVQVDKDGTVTAQGKQVTKVKVNGKEFFGGDVTTATRELNADMVDRIQVIDDYGDQSAFTGIRDGDPSKTLNIQLKKDKNKGYFGNVTAGAGTQSRYLASLSVNKFNNNQQLSLIGNLNNTNASTFNFGSMGGAIGSMVGGMMRSMGIGRGGGGVGAALGNFGINDGIANTKSIGLNYRNEWGTKISAYGSYSFSTRGTKTIREITQQNVFKDSSNTNPQHSDDYTTNENHRFSFNLEYRIDSFNYIKFAPSVTYNRSNTNNITDFSFLDNAGQKTNDGTTVQHSNSHSPNLNANLLFNHRFHKRGRTLSVNASAGRSSTEGENDYENLSAIYLPNGAVFNFDQNQFITQDNNNNNYGVRASYIEPINKKQSLEFNYAYNRQFTGNDKETFNVDSTGKRTFLEGQSNIYDNVYTTTKFGLNFRTNEKKYNYTVGFAVQPATIESNSATGKNEYKQRLFNYFPVVRFAYNFSRSRSFNINYNGITSQPTYSQLQPVYDSSNLQYITVGNPDLKPEFTNTLSMRYNNFDFITGNVFFSNISFAFTKDKIVSNIFKINPISQLNRYTNTNGYYTAFGFYNFSKPIQNRKYVFNIGGNVTYNNNVSFVENEKNTGRNWLIGQRFATDIKIKKWFETTIGVNYSLNSSHYSLQSELNSNATAWTLTQSTRLFLPFNIKFNSDIEKLINSGYSDNVNSDPFIINASIEKGLFTKQNASIKFQAFDLLNENISVNRSVTASSITDTRTNKLGRYFMLSVVFRLNKFSGQAQGNQMMPGMPGGMPMMRPGM
ncbi:MAG: outer membrane beta-barrel protein [Ferruginibacter sp.]